MKNKSIFIFAFVFFALFFEISSAGAYNFPHIFSRPKHALSFAGNYYSPETASCPFRYGTARHYLNIEQCAAVFQNSNNNSISINISDLNGVLNISEYPGILVAAGGGGVLLLKGGGYTELYGNSPWIQVFMEEYNNIFTANRGGEFVATERMANNMVPMLGGGGAVAEMNMMTGMQQAVENMKQDDLPILNVTYTDATGVVRYHKKYWKINIIASNGHEPVITLVNQKLQDLSRQQKIEFGDFVSHIKTLIAK